MNTESPNHQANDSTKNNFSKHSPVPLDTFTQHFMKKDLTPIVMIFNSNGSLYEYSLLQQDYVSFYLKKGVNVLMFNYRGCAKSKGEPEPRIIEKDCYEVYTQFREKFQVTQPIGLHGISIGGYFAIKLANLIPP